MTQDRDTIACSAAAWITFHGATRADRERAIMSHLPASWRSDRALLLLHETVEAATVDMTQAIIAERAPELAAFIEAAGTRLWRELPPPAQDAIIRGILQAEAMAAG